MNVENSRLARRLSGQDAIFLGLGSMIGAGIFAASGPAAMAAGSGLLLAIALAGTAAYLNATSMAQLAALYPESGGTYAYAGKQIGPFWGFIAGWGFVIGKIASCTAMALTFGYYATPKYAHLVAVATVLVITTINYFGVKKTVAATKVLLVIVSLTLVLLVGGALVGGEIVVGRLGNWFEHGGVLGVFEAAGLMFFAFAGYARVATLGEEVIDPKKTIPKAILVALGLTIIIYFCVLGTTLLVLPIEDLMGSKAPLALAIERSNYSFLAPLIRVGAAVASCGVLLSLIAGISRTVFAMASKRDLPSFLSSVHPKYKIPHKAELLVGIIVAVIVGFADLRTAIGFSSFAILIYYAISNVSALKLTNEERLFPKIFAAAGLIVCLTLAASLPQQSVIGGLILFCIGSTLYVFKRQIRLREV